MTHLATIGGRGDSWRGTRRQPRPLPPATTSVRTMPTLEFARTTATTVEPWVEGKQFFPRILADVAQARAPRFTS